MKPSQNLLRKLADIEQLLSQSSTWETESLRPPPTLLNFAIQLGFTVTPYQAEIYGLLSDSERRLLINLPVRHGKSQMCSINYPLWLMGIDCNIRIGLISNTATQAQSFLREVTEHIALNEKYQEIFPTVKPAEEKWTDSEILIHRGMIAKDPTMAAMGVTGPIIGRRFDVLICDDIVDEENSATELQRSRVETIFKKVLLPRLEPWGKAIIIGTRWAVKDLYGTLAAEGGWKHVNLKAINSDGHPLWPEGGYSLDYLAEQKQILGSVIYNCMFLNDPVGLEGRLFKRDWLRYADGSEQGDFIAQGVDLAISDKPESDYTVILTLRRTVDNRFIVESYRREHLDFPSQVRMVQAEAARWKPTVIGVEATAYQKALQQVLASTTTLPVVPLQQSKDKETRIYAALSPYFETGRILLKDKMWELQDELLSFPRGAHDDLCLAIDTKISTEQGEKNIQDIHVGDLVETQRGYGLCTAASRTHTNAKVLRLVLKDGRELLATPNHPIYNVKAQMFITLDSLLMADELCVKANREANKSNTTALHLDAIPTPNTLRTADITSPVRFISHKAFRLSTKKFGKPNMEPFPKATPCITLTGTPPITASRICNYFHEGNTRGNIWRNTSKIISTNSKLTRPRYAPSQYNGTVALKDMNGIENMATIYGKTVSKSRCHVLNADDLLRLGLLAQNTVQIARRRFKNGLTTMRVVAIKRVSERKPVYNLTLRGGHEYFANGILVHNCDALEMAMRLAVAYSGGKPGVARLDF